MKKGSALLCGALVCFAASQAFSAGTLFTFDDLAPGDSYVTIPSGYGGLDWTGFGVLNGSLQPVTVGYRTGMISAPNVAFNFDEYDRRAFISSVTAFNLDSGYMTAAFSAGLQVEVRGFVGAVMAYDHTYTVNSSGPEFINFDFLGVDQVEFLPLNPDIFVLDNVTISAVPEPNSLPLLLTALGAVGVGRLRNRGRGQRIPEVV